MKRSYSKVKEIVMKQILLSGDLKDFKIDDNLTVYADALENDMIVFDLENNPLVNAEFTFENKVYKTGENGEIVSIEDVVADEAPVEEVEVDATDEEVVEDVVEEVLPSGDLEAANKRIEELEVENQALKAELELLKIEAEELSNQPATQGINLSNIAIEEVAKPKSTLDVIRAALK